MSHTAIALLGYIGWTTFILLVLGTYRTALTLSGKKAANSFSPAGDDVSPFSGRLCRAHANCYEYFPIVGGLLLYALATNQSDVTNGLALIMLAARVVQSLIHIVSISVMAVKVRFFFFLVQTGIAIFWMYEFALGS